MAGPTLNTLTIRNGRRQTVADAYLDAEVRDRPNLTIVTDLLVDRLDFGAGVRCVGITAWRARRQVHLRAEAGVILCAGAIGSPSILMRSGIGCPDSLRAGGISPKHDLPGVGENLHDHLLSGGNVYRARRPVPRSQFQHSESLTYIAGDDPNAAPEFVLACVTLPITTDAFPDFEPGSGYTIMFGFTHPRSRGSVKLAGPDPTLPPIIDPGYLTDPIDREKFAEAMDWATCRWRLIGLERLARFRAAAGTLRSGEQ